MTATAEKTQQNYEIAKTIISQIPFMVRGCLNLKNGNAMVIENGVRFTRAIVTPQNNRGNIDIKLNAMDLYDIKAYRVQGIDAVETFSAEDIYAEDLGRILNTIWDR